MKKPKLKPLKIGKETIYLAPDKCPVIARSLWNIYHGKTLVTNYTKL